MAEHPEKLGRFLEMLRLVEDRDDRIELLIGVADRFRGVPPEVASPPYPSDHLVPNCESEAYFWAQDRPDGSIQIHFAVQNPQGISAKAMAVILDETLSGAPLEEVASLSTDLPYEIFGRELSMGKSMGLMGMVAMVQRAAKQRLSRDHRK